MKALTEKSKVTLWVLGMGFLTCLTLLSLCGVATAGTAGFRQVGTPNVPRYDATAHLLENGKVLIFDGSVGNGVVTPVVELYDPATESFSITGSMFFPRLASASAPLTDGRLLVAGGFNGDMGGQTSSAEVYDPATGTFSPTGSMTRSRYWSKAVRLNDGRVLFVGGDTAFPGEDRETEIYNPATGTFTVSGLLSHKRVEHTATLLLDGRVLITGGERVLFIDGEEPEFVTVAIDDAEIYDPVTGTSTPTGSMTAPRSRHTATRLADGRVLITGGGTAPGFSNLLKTAEIYDPSTGTFTPAGSMAVARLNEQATLISDGRVIITGQAVPPLLPGDEEFATEIFDPATGKFSRTWSMVRPRFAHNAVALQDGTVLVVNGYDRAAGESIPAEILVPPPPPVNGESVNVRPLAGEVATKCPGESRFTEIRDKDQIGVGCLVESLAGTVGLTSARARTGSQSAHFNGGVFKVTQKKGQTETTLTLTQPLRCGSNARASLGESLVSWTGATTSATRSRRIWGKGKGSFTTKGSKGSASVRGTEWLTEDRCNGTTLFRVRSGVVAVRDFAKKKTIMVKAGKSYVAGKKPKKKPKKKR